ncbi:PqqD family protein [Halopiger thermotolerans]
MTNLSASTRVSRTENCLATTIDGETVILHRDAEKYYGLNEVGTVVWESLQRPRTIAELCDAVTATYDVSPDRCRTDIEDVLVEMNEQNLVRFETA